MQSVTITTNVVSLNPPHVEVYSIQHYVIKFVSDLWQVGGFLMVLRFPPAIKTYLHNITASKDKTNIDEMMLMSAAAWEEQVIIDEMMLMSAAAWEEQVIIDEMMLMSAAAWEEQVIIDEIVLPMLQQTSTSSHQ
jgi:hypothetical protein